MMEQSEQFSLCWDNFHRNMSSGMNALLENEDLVDVTIAVGGKYLKAHKMVLSVCSPYFKDLFKVNPCKHPIVFLKDVSYVAMRDLLQFMYQGEVQVSQEHLTTFIKTAEALQIKGLTGDGSGASECDTEQKDDSDLVETKTSLPPAPKSKKVQPPPQHSITLPAPKRQRISAPEPTVSTSTITKTEPVVTSTPTSEQLVQFKMEPYDQNQSVTIPDDSVDDTFNDDPLDETNADDNNEDYSVMEGGDEEPQAGTSADGTAGEGQDINVARNETIRTALENTLYVGQRFSSYSELTEYIRTYEILNRQKFSRVRSRGIAASHLRRPIKPSLVYYEVQYECIHGVFRGTKGKGLRKRSTLRWGCGARFRLRACSTGEYLVVMSVNLEHTKHDPCERVIECESGRSDGANKKKSKKTNKKKRQKTNEHTDECS